MDCLYLHSLPIQALLSSRLYLESLCPLSFFFFIFLFTSRFCLLVFQFGFTQIYINYFPTHLLFISLLCLQCIKAFNSIELVFRSQSKWSSFDNGTWKIDTARSQEIKRECNSIMIFLHPQCLIHVYLLFFIL